MMANASEKAILNAVQQKINDAYDEGYQDCAIKMQDEITKIINMLDSVIKCWRMTEPNDPARAMVRAAGSAMVDKHKNAKSHQNKVDL